jgi:uncharacterized protein (TIGR02453 family)
MCKGAGQMSFGGFDAEGLQLLTELGTRDRAWFLTNKKRYDQLVAEPAKAFVEAMNDRLQESISPAIVGLPKTNGSISPINNDLRFAKGKAPYKDHLLFRWWEGANKKTAPTLFVRVSESSVGFASGSALDSARWRERVADDATGGALVNALKKLGQRRELEVAGAELKRVPKPYDAAHPRGDLLRHKGMFQARWPEPAPASITKAAFADWCAKRLMACADVHRWLVDLSTA